jgi:hypothetical protein
MAGCQLALPGQDLRVAGQGEQSGPGDQVGGDLGEDQPGGVDCELPRPEPAQPRVFGVPDAVLERTIEAKVVPCVLGSLTFASVAC